MADTTAGGTSGSDVLDGQGGDDDLYGQFDDAPGGWGGGDADRRHRRRRAGRPAAGRLRRRPVVGDQATAVQLAASALCAPVTLRTSGDFVVGQVRTAGSLVAQVTLPQPGVGGTDVLLGEDGSDALHGGAGHDLANGGAGDDALDLKVLTGDLTSWKAVAPVEDRDGLRATTNGRDTVTGGRGADRLQADEGDTGKVPGDRLLDGTGVHNLYAVCEGAYGAGKIQNKYDPATATLLKELARSTGSVCDAEIALPGIGEETSKHPLAPGNFTCES